jgi:hypothetical protein
MSNDAFWGKFIIVLPVFLPAGQASMFMAEAPCCPFAMPRMIVAINQEIVETIPTGKPILVLWLEPMVLIHCKLRMPEWPSFPGFANPRVQ